VPPIVSLLSDFGPSDVYAGVCEAVILAIAPDARVVHLSHGVPRQGVAQGARMLLEAIAYVPVGVHVAVVDPGVGSARRPLVIESGDGRRFVGPDNGLLLPAAEHCGGIAAAYEITEARLLLPHRSATFHGRDVFAPVAAHLAVGLEAGAVGPPVRSEALVRLPPDEPPEIRDGRMVVSCLHVDVFGNCSLGARSSDVDAAGLAMHASVRVLVDGRERGSARRGRVFADVPPGGLVLYEDSRGAAALGVNGGDAARRLGIEAGTRVTLERGA
jgi:S-adenosylmethionine hydrolase